jgi:fermentation-respiration switch protein FrsA (DUF1100 family)
MRRFKRVIYFLIIFYVMIASSLYFFQEKLIFFPTPLAQDYTFEFAYPFEELFLESDDGAIINAVHFKNQNPNGVIIYFHGNAGDLSRWGKVTEFFVEKNYDVFVMDYRTYGKSTGKISEQALYSDAQMCYDFLLKQYEASEIIIYGRSLGTGIATHLASKNNAKQLILETPFYSLADVAKHRFPLFPVKKLLKYDFLSYKYIQGVNCPVTIFHGTDDNVIPYNSGEKLFNSITQKEKVFFTIENGAHNNLVEFESYHKAIQQILP